MQRVVVLCAVFSKTEAIYSVQVTNRSLTSRPLLQYNTTSFAQNTLNPAWLPLPGHPGGGIFFRTLGADTPGYNAVGFVQSITPDGLHFPKVTQANLLSGAEGADPRATARPATGDYFVTYQMSNKEYPGRHTFISRTRTPLNASRWEQSPVPMFAGLKKPDGSAFIASTSLVQCNSSNREQQWEMVQEDAAVLVRRVGDTVCLSLQPSPDPSLTIGVVPCATATRWIYNSSTLQMEVAGTSGRITNDGAPCLDVDHGQGPRVDLYSCHAPDSKDFKNQQWRMMGHGRARGSSVHQTGLGAPFMLRSASAVGQQCLAVRKALINDCGTALWFPDDATTTAAAAVVAAAAAAAAADGLSANGTSKTAAASGTNTSAASTPCAYAVATFGELRGGNISLVRSHDLVCSALTTTSSLQWWALLQDTMMEAVFSQRSKPQIRRGLRACTLPAGASRAGWNLSQLDSESVSVG
jgi:hypothetical protein